MRIRSSVDLVLTIQYTSLSICEIVFTSSHSNRRTRCYLLFHINTTIENTRKKLQRYWDNESNCDTQSENYNYKCIALPFSTRSYVKYCWTVWVSVQKMKFHHFNPFLNRLRMINSCYAKRCFVTVIANLLFHHIVIFASIIFHILIWTKHFTTKTQRPRSCRHQCKRSNIHLPITS